MDWGIVGYGWVARDHMHPALNAAGHRVAGVVDPLPEARGMAADSGLPAFADLAALAEQVDAVYVATPNHRHAEPVERLLQLGVPVLCEKPMAAGLEDSRRIAGAAAASGTLYGTAFDQRHHPAHRRMRALIAQGRIGRVVAVRIVYACWVDPLWSAGTGSGPNWRADPAAAGGGAVIDLALHGLDLAEMLLGEPLVDLHIMLQRRLHDYPVEDGGLLSGRFGSGALLQSHVAYNCAEQLPRRRLEILGEHGLLIGLDTMGQTAGGRLILHCARTGDMEDVSFDTAASPFEHQARAFAAAVRGDAHEFCAVRDLALMTLFDGAYRDAKACL